ncbi:hypothetical protein A0H81_00974 [Grifola frondosa]|uniref:Uncharacterized protein n=1 Tax=Grifola frondosa TaxID=5627 RepID=A0A1C7MNX6_GRIFR|nr:hypothetical protein A0H81_00974 [Grifola frondosa]
MAAGTFDIDASLVTTTTPNLWRLQLKRAFGLNHPRVVRILRYLRGPRPKVDLPDPTPFLVLTLNAGRRTYSRHLSPLSSALPVRSRILGSSSC